MHYLLKPIFLLLLIILSSCALNSSATNEDVVLYNPILSEDKLTVSVSDKGCTSEQNFNLLVKGDSIFLEKHQPDNCLAYPRLKELVFEYNFGNKEYQFKNEVRTDYRLKPIIKNAE
ncbi:hypothetical protein [Reinekea thalattae]|uniref:Lipoprotein n=1 Tax=Reinekea thalattae TaxID=2593301 RepID=A0A5C8ZBG5_9GAMM|nr:hypothetical protein [Reinekea thalattae]TXR54236.1 hypothetical protein FME95_06790 [Reinekea thalattae]